MRARVLFLLLAFATGGCASTGHRRVPAALAPEVAVYVDDRRVTPDAAGQFTVPNPAGERGEQNWRLEAPGRAPVTARVWVLVDPPPELEDRLVTSGGTNTVIYRSGGERGGVYGADFEPAYVWPEPVALLASPDGAWRPPAAGEGVIVVGPGPGARVQTGERTLIMEPLAGRPAGRPLVIRLAPGAWTLRITRPGYRPLEAVAAVRKGSYTLVSAQLAPREAGRR